MRKLFILSNDTYHRAFRHFLAQRTFGGKLKVKNKKTFKMYETLNYTNKQRLIDRVSIHILS